MPKTTLWDLEAHTGVKHSLLRSYLGAWFPIIGRYSGRMVFIDGFAGPGQYEGGEPGSPLIALSTYLDHAYAENMTDTQAVFVFNEQDKARFKSLSECVEAERQRRGNWPEHVRVVLENKNFSEVAEDILESLDGQSLAPTFAFLDPFGYKDVSMDMIKRLMSYSKSELFIYLDINSLTRFATAGTPSDKHFEALYGTDRFREAPPAGSPNRKQFLHDLYEEQLRSVVGYKHVQSFEMVGANNKPINYLFFCTQSPLGLDRMKSVMWKAAPTGTYRYVDELGGKTVLFEEEPDTSALQEILSKTFAGRTVSIEELEDYVITRTPYIKSHLKTRTLVPMQRAGQIDSPNQRQKFRFPPQTLVAFSGTPVADEGRPTTRPSFS